VNVHKLIQRTLRGRGLAGGIDAVVSANAGEHGRTTTTRLHSRRRIVQRGGTTLVDEHEVRTGDAAGEDHATERRS
jgi:hypothetical protein